MKKKEEGVITIGLFGTCGGSQWRLPFIQAFETNGMGYFNPQVDDWDDSYAPIEAEHLVEDEIILFPVTSETYGNGSLAEVGFSINQAIRSDNERFVVVFVDPTVDAKLKEDNAVLAKDSTRSRALVLAHLKKQASNYPNVYVVDSLDKMWEVSFHLYESMSAMKAARKFCMK